MNIKHILLTSIIALSLNSQAIEYTPKPNTISSKYFGSNSDSTDTQVNLSIIGDAEFYNLYKETKIIDKYTLATTVNNIGNRADSIKKKLYNPAKGVIENFEELEISKVHAKLEKINRIALKFSQYLGAESSDKPYPLFKSYKLTSSWYKNLERVEAALEKIANKGELDAGYANEGRFLAKLLKDIIGAKQAKHYSKVVEDANNSVLGGTESFPYTDMINEYNQENLDKLSGN